jgi:hypothetical protein
MTETKNEHWKIGKTYFIRTVTFHYTGVLVSVHAKEIVMKDVAWIADDGRFADALKNWDFNEVEPYPDGEVLISRGAILDAYACDHKPPRIQK